MPLLFQGHIDLLEEYLSRSRDHQAAFVELVDQLIDSDTNIDAIVRSLSASSVSLSNSHFHLSQITFNLFTS